MAVHRRSQKWRPRRRLLPLYTLIDNCHRAIGLLTLRGYTQRTHESYIRAVAALSRHYGPPPDRLSDGQIRDYLIGLHQRGLSRSSINVAISALRLF